MSERGPSYSVDTQELREAARKLRRLSEDAPTTGQMLPLSADYGALDLSEAAQRFAASWQHAGELLASDFFDAAKNLDASAGDYDDAEGTAMQMLFDVGVLRGLP